MTITNSTISGNSANTGDGGGIDSRGPVTITNSTISGNSAVNGGGGIDNNNTLTITNSTISGNSTVNRGGGINNSSNTLTITNSTISGNSIDPRFGGGGGGIMNSAILNMVNTIVGSNPAGGDCSGTITSGSHNLDSDGTCVTDGVNNDITADPLLGPLQNNTGPTETHALLPGSPAIDTGDDAVCAAPPVSGLDQRGLPRPLGAACDIGAVELFRFVAVTKEEDTNDGVCDDDCSLREAIIFANSISGEKVVTLPAGTYTLSIPGTDEDSSETGDLDITDNLIISGAGPNQTFIDGGAIDTVIHVHSGITVEINELTIQSGNSPGEGGGINISGGALTLSASAVSGNASEDNGGGIYNSSGTLAVTSSTISDNTSGSTGNGGGIYNSSGDMTIANSTISGNTSGALADGGGIYNASGDVTITNGTITENSSGILGEGSGIFNAIGVVFIVNTIIGDNVFGGDCFGLLTSLGHNLDSDGSCNLAGLGDLSGFDPLLGPLQNNGGPTEIHALLGGSPAIDTGDDAVCAAPPVSGLDQRGVPRPQGLACDIGAFEANPADLSVSLADSPDPVIFGENLTYTVDVTNGGPELATNVVLTDILPDEVAFVSANPTKGTCAEAGGTVKCDLETLDVLEAVIIDIVVIPPTQLASLPTLPLWRQMRLIPTYRIIQPQRIPA